MPLRPPSRRLRRRERARRRRFLGGTLATLLLLLASVFQLSRQPPVQAVDTQPENDRTAELVGMPTAPLDGDEDSAEEPAYPYSIIPGGVRSAEMLRRAIAADPIVRAHYAKFDLAKVHLVRLTEPRVAHVSYRVGDKVFWTRRALLLKTDETLLTDGAHYARTRSGDQLAVFPGATSRAEPSLETLDRPVPVGKSPAHDRATPE